MPTTAQALLLKEITSLVQRLRLFTPARWQVTADPWGTRADLVRHLAQSLADSAAALEGEPRRPLPVLGVDLLVVDQLAVTGDDLVRTEPPDDICADTVAHLLLHRYELLGEEPPTSLGGPTALKQGRQICAHTQEAGHPRG